jgi:hypothetical protein
MVAEPHSTRSELEAWQHAEKLRIAAQYPGEDEDLTEAILETPWRDTLEDDVRKAFEQHMSWAAAERANGYYTFPSDDLFWLNVELLLPDYEQFLSKAKRESPEGRAFMERARRVYPPSLEVICRMDVKQ